jgi:hypothetical protein
MAGGPRTQTLGENGKAPEPEKGRQRRVRRDTRGSRARQRLHHHLSATEAEHMARS